MYPASLFNDTSFFTLTRLSLQVHFHLETKDEADPTEERTKQKVKEYVYGTGSQKKSNGRHDNSSDGDSYGGSDGKNKKAKARFTHTVKG